MGGYALKTIAVEGVRETEQLLPTDRRHSGGVLPYRTADGRGAGGRDRRESEGDIHLNLSIRQISLAGGGPFNI